MAQWFGDGLSQGSVGWSDGSVDGAAGYRGAFFMRVPPGDRTGNRTDPIEKGAGKQC
ncbi:hypothetical protein SALBM135S_05284 [Streptomyces alboniger]